MPAVKKTIEVNAPVDRVYEFWNNFENFPQFMERVDEVRITGPNTSHWVVDAPTQKVEWDATTTENVRNQRISWRASGESGQNGTVSFEPLGADRTRVTVSIEYHLESGMQEKLASVFNIDDRMVQNDLNRFKETVEDRSSGKLPTGGTGPGY